MSATSGYLRYLPSVYTKADTEFLAGYLNIFEKLLTGLADEQLGGRRGIQELLASNVIGNLFYSRFSFLFPADDQTFIPPISGSKDPDALLRNFDSFIGVPEDAPLLSGYVVAGAPNDSLTNFNAWLDGLLNWMAGWVELVLDGSWSLDKKRTVLAQIMALYRLRGTAQGMSMMLNLLLDLPMQVSCYTPLLSTQVMGTLSVDVLNPQPPSFVISDAPLKSYNLPCAYQPGKPLLSGYAPWLFLVQVKLPTFNNPNDVLNQDGANQVKSLLGQLSTLLDAIKPAGCHYQMQILGGMYFQPDPPPDPTLPNPQLDSTAILGSQMPST